MKDFFATYKPTTNKISITVRLEKTVLDSLDNMVNKGKSVNEKWNRSNLINTILIDYFAKNHVK